ncbi:HAMP domain-containing sensor histidine kinase [Castellaniella sp.]|uniref:sensor histidine kinase n=1 Tax=Castellaniella sp. TaxID=1955812 RepID=UPI0025BB3478|nr:HAMP domain-containing sensor histidine kinase [Castellaniella sp.]
MMRSVSLADRVTWALTGTVAVFLLVIGLLAYEVFTRMEDDLVDDVVATQVQALRNDLAAGQNVSAVLPTRAGDGALIEAWMREFGWILGGGALIVLLCAWWLSRHLARRVVAPIRLVSERLSTWSLGEERAVAASGDEAAQLVDAFGLLQDHIDRAMAFERQFAANLSHELRTPLAALRSDGEMALLEITPGSPLRDRLQRMLDQVDTVASSLSSAVAINSADPARMRAVRLCAALEEAWFGLQPLARMHGLMLMNRIPAGASCWLDPHALLIVLRNLLRNAIEHAAPATLAVTLDGAVTLVFRDDGPGIAPDRLRELQQWHSGRSDQTSRVAQTRLGHGLGLGIARRVCDLQGWRLSVNSVKGEMSGWTEFRLVLPTTARCDVDGFSG